MSLRYPTDDHELAQIVRGETSYEDTEDELPSTQLDTIIEQAKAKVELETGTNQWYSDKGIGFALAAYTKIRAKAAVENISLSSYSMGAEEVSFADADPEDSHQLQTWHDDVLTGLDATDVDTSGNLQPKNSADYIGESYI